MLGIKAREFLGSSEKLAKKYFQDLLDEKKHYDYQYVNVSLQNLIIIGEFTFQVPALNELYKEEELAVFFDGLSKEESHLFLIKWEISDIEYYTYSNDEISKRELSNDCKRRILNKLVNYREWAGYLNEAGEHVIDLRNPVPGAHFYTNMLLGNRMGFPFPLQTTPKSVVDRFGGGSFRAHAATQVLATRWDMLPEENGFPANRQFYLVEQGKQIFYSMDVMSPNIKSAICRHSQNHTQIEYITNCGLHIIRRIFLLPQYEGLPIATEVQRITIKNLGDKKRKVKIVLTGMLGSPVPGALMEDVVYSTVIMESGLVQDEQGNMLAYVPHYYPDASSRDVRFMTAMFYEQEEKRMATELCTNYGDFIGNGSLYHPEGLSRLSNKLRTKGPGFVALGAELSIDGNGEAVADQFTGLISTLSEEVVKKEMIYNEIQKFHDKFVRKEAVEDAFQRQHAWYNNYKAYLQLESSKEEFNAYVNNNLPFQVLYQTFVSRSFDLTQKGYREIGFREIQDIYASMYYFMAMGETTFVKQLLKEWIEKVFEYGYCYHNFFWKGKEAGKWSDDGLWLVQAVYRYIRFSDDLNFLEEQFEIPETNGRKRTLYETLKAILHYSSTVSVGKHGMPLIDYADWNDCLKVDSDYLTGPEKEKKNPSLEDYSESVMNAFLLKIAMNHVKEFALEKGDEEYLTQLENKKSILSENLQKYAWKGDFFARVLFNRFGDAITYLGAGGDGFSNDDKINGTYFLNSFSWSVLSEEATEEQIAIMIRQIECYLKGPYGFSLMSPTDLSRVAKATATGEYFQGDRENGGIFKHATMMATAAMVKASKIVKEEALAKKLRDLAYWMVNLVLPYNTLEHPFFACGNPRWCTQYINSQTGEHIGPTLSGTSTWLTLTIFEILGIEYKGDKLILNPMLSEEEESLRFTLKHKDSFYQITIRKPIGLYRTKDNKYQVTVDGKLAESNEIILLNDQLLHQVEMEFYR